MGKKWFKVSESIVTTFPHCIRPYTWCL